MSNDRPTGVLGALPRTRPHRRSEKRAGAAMSAPAPEPVPASTRAPGTEPLPASTPAPGTEPLPASTPAPGRGGQTASAKADPPQLASALAETAEWPHPRPLRQPAQPQGVPTTPRKPHPEPTSGPDILDTAVQAAAELAEIGLTLSARAIRRAVARLPKP